VNDRPERTMRSRSTGKVRIVAVVGIMVATIASCVGPAPTIGSDPKADSATVATAAVKRQDLTIRDEFSGTLGFAASIPLVAARDGVLTWMPDEGTVVKRGEAVTEIDGAATRLLYGERPAWRRLALGVPNGSDIRQLNDNLVTLGYAEREDLSRDEFDWRTREAVYRWQDDLGKRTTGSLELGDVMFVPSKVRIGTIEVQPGMWVGAGQILAHATGTDQLVTVDIDPAKSRDLRKGSSVTVVLPDSKRMPGIVRSVGRVVATTAEPDAEPIVELKVDLGNTPSGTPRSERSPSLRGLDVGPVIVRVEHILARNVLVVPVGALVALPGAGYAVERMTARGTELVTVKPGRFAEALVEITGDLAEGDEVVVPS
jgi:hypothetical protein